MMFGLVAVKGPTVMGGEGICSVTPVDGIGFGMGTSKATAPVEIDYGVAPWTSNEVDMVPVSDVRPTAAAP